MKHQHIPVTKPFLPPRDTFDKYIDGIWERNWLTNNGPLVNKLEADIMQYLDTPNFLFTGNGTIALQLAIKALDLKGEIITTPFSYIATTSSIIWENCKPIFVDIDESRLTIDYSKIENSITADTSAILATHVFGIPCHVEEIQDIALKHNLKVIYDAAHAFGTKYKNKSLLAYGDISTLSTHATKLFHTIEGGGIVCNDEKLLKKIALLRNFGHDGLEIFNEIGINGKNSEFHAAMGLANLNHIEEILQSRKSQCTYYYSHLNKTNITFPQIPEKTIYNHAYFPIIFPDETILLRVQERLNSEQIFPRRYFYPALNKIKVVNSHCITPLAESISKRVLCLPLYNGIEQICLDKIITIIKRYL